MDLYNQGKIELSNPPDVSTTLPPSELIPAPVASNATPVVDTKPHFPSMLSVALEFQNLTLGDRLKTLFVMMLSLFLLYNMWTWQKTLSKINSLERIVKDLQDVVKALKHIP
ncbi:hypothetical protein EON65_17920 [archaeon]|nr:MAG: hypothetical protein EON65_17920 [archaeon]